MLVMTAVVAWFRRIARGHLAQRRGNVFIENGIWIVCTQLESRPR